MRPSISVHDLPAVARRGVYARAVFALFLIAASLFASAGALAQAKTPVAGVDYQVLETPVATASGGKIEVLEFFNYACGHCNDFSSTLNAWKRRQPKDVAIRYEAAPYGGFFDEMARAFYAARILGVVPKTHDAIFRDVHETRAIRPGDKTSIIDAYTRLGVDRARFGAEYDSARVDERLRLAKALMIAADVGGVPSLIVAGRYRIDAGEGISFESMLATADHLIRMERARIARAKR